MSEIKKDKGKRYEDKNVTRVDIRVPNNIYEEIEKLAVLTNQPPTPKSKNTDNPKPSVTTIMLKLIELGLGVMENQGIEVLGEGIEPVPNSHIFDDLEERIFNRLEARLEALIETKLKAYTLSIDENKEDKSLSIDKDKEDKSLSIDENKEDKSLSIDKDKEDKSLSIEEITKIYQDSMPTFYRIKHALLDLGDGVVSIEELANALECEPSNIENKNLSPAQLHFLSYYSRREDGKFDSCIIDSFLDSENDVVEDVKQDNSETITPEIMIENEVIERVSSGNNNNENEYVKNLNAIEVIPEVLNEDKEVSAIEGNSEAISENEFENGLFSKGLGNRLGYKGHSEVSKKFKDLSKEDFIQWTKEKDKDGIGWYRNETDNKYYPQK